MDEDEGSSPPFALELPQNDVIFVDQETRTKRDVDRSFSERPIELENINYSQKDNEDSNSSCTSSVGNLSEVAPDIPPDYNDNPCTYLEREGAVAPAGLTMPAVVAGNVGNMHFSINNGGGATSGAHRTSCSINDTLTEVLTAESIEACGDGRSGYDKSSDRLYSEVSHDECKHFSGGNHYHTHHVTNINLHVHSLAGAGGEPELTGVAEQIKQMIDKIRITSPNDGDLLDGGDTSTKRGNASRTSMKSSRAAPILVRTGETVDIYNVDISSIHPPLGRQTLWYTCGLGSEWYTTPLRWFISMASILIACLLIYLLVQLLVVDTD